jgi:hypothetical protein
MNIPNIRLRKLRQLRQLKIGFIFLVASLTTYTASLTVGNEIAAQSRRTNYGLGLPRTARTGTGVRQGNCPPLITALVPPDGAKTLTPRPTFYWHVAPQDCNNNHDRDSDQSTVPPGLPSLPLTPESTEPKRDREFMLSFSLREVPVKAGELQLTRLSTIFKTKSFAVANQPMLYSYTLAAPAPALEPDQVSAWHIRWRSPDLDTQVDANSLVVYEKNAAVEQALADANSVLEQARILAENGYWYDALHVYSDWLRLNPDDTIAREERSALLAAGMSGYENLNSSSNGDVVTIEDLLPQISAAKIIELDAISDVDEADQ